MIHPAPGPGGLFFSKAPKTIDNNRFKAFPKSLLNVRCRKNHLIHLENSIPYGNVITA